MTRLSWTRPHNDGDAAQSRDKHRRFHDWVHMLWHSKEWFDSNADTPVGGWAFESQHGQAHGDPEFGDVVISRQEFARLLWRCESMGDRPPVCQWIAPDECPEDIWWRA